MGKNASGGKYNRRTQYGGLWDTLSAAYTVWCNELSADFFILAGDIDRYGCGAVTFQLCKSRDCLRQGSGFSSDCDDLLGNGSGMGRCQYGIFLCVFFHKNKLILLPNIGNRDIFIMITCDYFAREMNIMQIQFVNYPKCSTCQKARKWLNEQQVDYLDRPIKEENPSAEELKEWLALSGLPLKRFFNTSGLLYKEMGLKDKLPGMSQEEQIALLASDGMLVKRPIVVGEDFVLVGFKEAEWKERLGKTGM